MKARRSTPGADRLSVGMFTYSTAPRGSVVHAAALAEALMDKGCDVTLYALNKGGEGFYRDVRCSLQLVPAQIVKGPGELLVRQRIDELAAYLKRQGVIHDVLHAQDCLTANALMQDGARTRGHVVRTVHHVEHFECPYLSSCQERSIRNVDAVCAVSHSTAREVRQRFGRKVRVVGNGVDASRLQATLASEVVSVRGRLLKGRSGPLILSIGGVEPRKNSQRTLEAFFLVKQTYPGAVWVIAGGSTVLDHHAYDERFEAKLSDSPWRHDVVRHGLVEERLLGALLGAADVVLNASVQEGFGLSILEALAAGLPVVVSKGAPFDEYLADETAFFVEPTSPSSIAFGTVMALEEPHRCQLSGRQVALTHTWRAVAERTLDAYEQAFVGCSNYTEEIASVTHA